MDPKGVRSDVEAPHEPSTWTAKTLSQVRQEFVATPTGLGRRLCQYTACWWRERLPVGRTQAGPSEPRFLCAMRYRCLAIEALHEPAQQVGHFCATIPDNLRSLRKLSAIGIISLLGSRLRSQKPIPLATKSPPAARRRRGVPMQHHQCYRRRRSVAAAPRCDAPASSSWCCHRVNDRLD